MKARDRSTHSGSESAILLAVIVGTPASVCAAEPLETIREAFRVSSHGLTSGTGKGVYRHYRAIGAGDWQLMQDADLTTSFDGRKYHIDLVYRRDELRKDHVRRIIYDGKTVTEAWFTPAQHPTGAEARVSRPLGNGGGLSRPWNGVFPWDVSQLVRNVWDPETSVRGARAQDLEIVQTAVGDLVMSHRLIGRDRVRFQFPHQSGFNIGRLQHFNEGQTVPTRDVRVEWKQDPSGLWCVRSLDETQVLRDAKNAVWRVRDVLKYTEFEPNAKVDPRLFTEAALRLPSRSRIIDDRPGAQ